MPYLLQDRIVRHRVYTSKLFAGSSSNYPFCLKAYIKLLKDGLLFKYMAPSDYLNGSFSGLSLKKPGQISFRLDLRTDSGAKEAGIERSL